MTPTRDSSAPPGEGGGAAAQLLPMRASLEFDDFYAANVRVITGQIFAYTGDRAEAEDLVAEAFCRALARWRKVREYENPTAWVRRVAWNLATSHLRRRGVVQRFLNRQRETHEKAPDGDRVDLMRALAGIGEHHRKAVILRYMAGLTVAEIAEQEGVAEATVRSWLTRGKAALAGRLTVQDEMEQR
ncbi:RNA polymerase sigma factor [Glycomyces sp. MUSA5-2]|uniref:RNA polymerase sigma factor n=1 Tax=Glycomyces sp. MUSA5-2 TaxID=2053002 RepID=UPI00300BC1E6